MTASAGDAALTVEQVDLIRRRVINVVGHELRTPVSTLAGLAAELESAPLNDVHERLAPAIRRLAERTEALLDDLLVASGVSTALPVEPDERIDLRAAVAVAAEAIGIEQPPAVEGDVVALAPPDLAARVLRNLLRNADVYGEHDVRVSLERAGERARCVIRNPAPGATTDELALAFEAFFRGEHAVLRSHGFGMGLTVARILARHAGGDVALDLHPDGEVAVTLELPAG